MQKRWNRSTIDLRLARKREVAMKTGFHRFAAFFGIGCAIVFALTPILAGADAGPGMNRRPTTMTPPPITPTPTPGHPPGGKKTIHGGKVDDGGCQDSSMRSKTPTHAPTHSVASLSASVAMPTTLTY
jgi:hypothetical protein